MGRLKLFPCVYYAWHFCCSAMSISRQGIWSCLSPQHGLQFRLMQAINQPVCPEVAMWPLLLQLTFPGLKLPQAARELDDFVLLLQTPPAPFLLPDFAKGSRVSPCPGTAYFSTWSPLAALLGSRAVPALTARHHRESDEPQQGSFTQPQWHLLLD